MGEGISKFLEHCSETAQVINKKTYDIVYRLLLRTVTSQKYQGSEALSDWMRALTLFFRFPESNQAVSKRREKLS